MRTMMRREVLAALVLCLTAGMSSRVGAGIVSVSSPVSLEYKGNVTYENTEFGVFTGPGAILSATFSNSSPISSLITYDNHPDFTTTDGQTTAGGLRIAEVITNNSGMAWTNFEIRLSGTAGRFFYNVDAPAIATIVNPSGPDPLETGVVKYNNGNNGGQVVLSSNFMVLDFSLATPIAPGGSVDFQNSLTGLDLNGGSFTFTFAPNPFAVPEPSTIVLSSVSGLMGLAYCARRQRRAKVVAG